MPAPFAIAWSEASLALRFRMPRLEVHELAADLGRLRLLRDDLRCEPTEAVDRVLPGGRGDAVGDRRDGSVAIVGLLRRADVAAGREDRRLRPGEGGREVVDDELQRSGVDDLQVVARRGGRVRPAVAGAPPEGLTAAGAGGRRRRRRATARRVADWGADGAQDLSALPPQAATMPRHGQQQDEAEPRARRWKISIIGTSWGCRSMPGPRTAARGGRGGAHGGSPMPWAPRVDPGDRALRATPRRSVSTRRGAPGFPAGYRLRMRLPVRAPDRADAGEGERRPARGRRLAVRAQVGRLPRARVQGRRRGLHAEPRPQAARPLLPRARGPAPRAAARALRARRRGRDRPRRRARLRGAAAADPPGGVAREDARRGDAGLVRGVGPARARRRGPARRAPGRAPGAPRGRPRRASRRPCT